MPRRRRIHLTEGAGVVEQVGKRCDHVVLSYQSCGRCRPCRSGHPVHCRRFYEANFGLLIALHRAGQFPFERLEKFYDFSEINRAIADARRGDTIKPVLRIGGADRS